jgi:formate/nitrite transporter FocA (FNT family)
MLTGADLCTGSFLVSRQVLVNSILLSDAVHHCRSSPEGIVCAKDTDSLSCPFFGNLVRPLFIAGIIIGYGGISDSFGYKQAAITFATTKQVTLGWHRIFIRGIGANWLVCLACYLGMSSRELFSRVVGI